MEKKFLSTKEFAEYMGVHAQTVRRWINEGMPAIKKGTFSRILIEEAVAWLETFSDKEKNEE